MAIDREETLRKAEKLLRQGRLDAAIAEYERVAESYPGDLVTVDKLGDLYQRAGRTSDATTCYGRVADHWLLEGLHAKAATKYKKILKLTPDDEGAMLQLVEAMAQQGLLEEAKTHLRAALDRRLGRGDMRGADELTLKLADLDPNDFEAWLAGLKLRVRDYPEADLAPVLRDAMARLDRKGRPEEADALALSVIELDPDDVASRVRAARAALTRGDREAAQALLQDPSESESYDIVLIAAELALADAEARRRWFERLLQLDRARAAADLAAFGGRLAPADVDAAYACIETLADHHAISSEFRAATDLVTHFLAQSPGHLPALLRLVELCVDGDFDAELTQVQAALADVYLEVGQALQAKVIAEDLLGHDPRSAVHRDRLHRALVALGVDEPDAVIEELISAAEEALGEQFAEMAPPKPAAPPAPEEPDFGVGVSSPAAAFGVESELDGLETPWAGDEGPTFQAADLGGLGPIEVAPPPAVPEAAPAPAPAPKPKAARPRAKTPEGKRASKPDQESAAAPPAPAVDAPAGHAPSVEALPVVAPADDIDLTQEIDLTAALDAIAEGERARVGTSGRAHSSTTAASAHVKGGEPAAQASPFAAEPDAGAPTTNEPETDEPGTNQPGTNQLGTNQLGTNEQGDAAEDEDDLEAFFESRRENAANQLADLPQTDQSVRLLAMAETYQAAGMIHEAEGALEQAAADPRYRFRAALALGRLLWREGRSDEALGWLGQASEAPAPSPDDAHAVLYELAERLEAAGETTRALAVLLDLVAEREDYRDARERIDRLVRYDAEP